MGGSLTQPRRVSDEGLRVVKLCREGRRCAVIRGSHLTVPRKKAPANSVPAAAVIRRVQALLGITGRKAGAGGLCKSGVKARGSTPELHLKLPDLSQGEGSGIPGVEVKFVDIRRNICGEGGYLALY
jgi:hypothetical protein